MTTAAPPSNRSQLFYAGIWVAITLLLVIGSQLVGISQAEGDSSDLDASDFPLESVDPTSQDRPSVLYGGVLWSLQDVRITDAEGLLGRASLEVDLDATNTLANIPLRASASLISVFDRTPVTGDEEVRNSEGRILEVGQRLTIEPGETERVTVLFEVPFSKTPDRDDLGLLFKEPNRIQAILPLDGTVLDSGYPLAAAIDTEPATVQDPDSPNRQIVIEANAASVDVNAGPHRASMGHQLVTIKLTVQRSQTLDEPGFADIDFWALALDDADPQSPLVVAKTAQPSINADEVTLLFSFPDDAEGLQLLAGFDQEASIPIALPKG